MSTKIRVFTVTVAATLALGTTAFGASEPRQSRRAAIEDPPSFVEQLFERVRGLFAGRIDSEQIGSERTQPPAPGAWEKDGSGVDPNGNCTTGCHK